MQEDSQTLEQYIQQPGRFAGVTPRTWTWPMEHVQTSTCLGSLWHLPYTHLSIQAPHFLALRGSHCLFPSWRYFTNNLLLAKFPPGIYNGRNLWSHRFRIHFLWPARVSRRTLPLLAVWYGCYESALSPAFLEKEGFVHASRAHACLSYQEALFVSGVRR